MNPKISVVIPAFNEEKLLPRCLKALQNQSCPRNTYEVLVIDNGSTDRTAQIAKEFGVITHRYDYIRKCGAVRQFGVSKAKAPIIAFTDADSQVPDDWLETIDKLFKDPKLICIGGKVLPDKGNLTTSYIYKFYNICHSLSQRFHKTLLWGSSLVVRKSALESVGGFNISLSTSDDWDLSIRLQKKFGKKSVLYTKKLGVYVSTRKQDDMKVFYRYSLNGIRNYVNVVLLGDIRSSDLETIR